MTMPNDPDQIPEISVVMPVYNAAATLDATIASVLAQRDVALHLVVIDDGSSDDSLARLHAAALRDPRIRVVARANGGVSSARNLGVELAIAPLVAFIDADDLWAEDKLSAHVALHRRFPEAALSYARIAFIAPEATGLNGARTLSSLCPHDPGLADVLGDNPVCTASNMVVRRDAFLAVGGFDTALSHAEDQELVARLIARAGVVGGAVKGIDAVLVGYRLSPGGLSMDLERMYAGWREVAARYLPERERLALEALYCRYLARRTLRAGGRPLVALHYVLAGLRLDASAFLAERRRGLGTIAGALIALVLPSPLRLRLFA